MSFCESCFASNSHCSVRYMLHSNIVTELCMKCSSVTILDINAEANRCTGMKITAHSKSAALYCAVLSDHIPCLKNPLPNYTSCGTLSDLPDLSAKLQPCFVCAYSCKLSVPSLIVHNMCCSLCVYADIIVALCLNLIV